ncbi:TetR/AcrR family transcriptional regulator [Nocardia callitridis]|uniref:TetR/AcrR family transcriptional regulator n=1 Tax=Nocardia callitridis TaxID=648753 RepID=A0ABP9KS81_9NOCA
MGTKGSQTRAKLLDATRALIEKRGYYGAGLNQIIETSGAPRGSLYYHFPSGKDQIVAEAVAQAGAEIAAALSATEDGDSPTAPTEGRGSADLATDLLTVLGNRLEATGWAAGCPVAQVTLDIAATSDQIQAKCAAAYESWERAIRDRLAAEQRPDAEDLATSLLAMVEGGLLLARAKRSRAPLEQVGRVIRSML